MILKKSAILILDFINDIVNCESKFAKSAQSVAKNEVIKNANKLINYGRENNILLIFVKVGFSASYKECPLDSPLFAQAKKLHAYQLGTWGTEFHPDLNIEKEDLVVIKHRVSAFYATGLETILRANKIESLILCGVSTDLVVQTTARDAHDRDYEVTVIKDACAADNDEITQQVFNALSKVANIKTVNEFCQAEK